jgi:hypothetical protein
MSHAYKLTRGCTFDSKTEHYATMRAEHHAHQRNGRESDKVCHRCDVYCS